MNYPTVNFTFGAMPGSLLAGVLCGLLPLAVGIARQRYYLGRGGLFLCFILGLSGGVFMALPAALAVSVVILLLGTPKPRSQTTQTYLALLPQPTSKTSTATALDDPSGRPSALAAVTDTGVVLSCGKCSFMIPAEGNRVPPWCPHCGADIKRAPATPAVSPPPVPAEVRPSPVAADASRPA